MNNGGWKVTLARLRVQAVALLKTGITPATVNKALGHLEQLSIVKELTARKRNRLFSYVSYIEIMDRGTELPGR